MCDNTENVNSEKIARKNQSQNYKIYAGKIKNTHGSFKRKLRSAYKISEHTSLNDGNKINCSIL